VEIAPVTPASFDTIAAGPSTVVRVSGNITGLPPAVATWKWTVTLADGSLVPVSKAGPDTPGLVDFPVATYGTYTIAAELVGAGCTGLRTITVAAPGAHTSVFQLRVTPPSTETAPAQSFERQVVGATPSGANVLALDPGIPVSLQVVRATGGAALPAYVRLTETTSGTLLEARTSTSGPVTLLLPSGRAFSTLVVPDGDVAPMTLPPRSPGQFGAGALALADGALVQGSVQDAAGAPLPGATIVLRAGDLVSTTGTTDAQGAFHVRVHAGTFGVTVVVPMAGGGLEARLDAAAGLVIDEAAAAPALAIKLHPGPLAQGSVALRAMDAASLTADTPVTLTSMAPLADVATLTVGAGAPRSLAGAVRASLHPDGGGVVATGGLPRGVYALTVVPAAPDTSDGVTTTTLDLSGGDLAPTALTLTPKVRLRGQLLPADMAAGVRMIAFDEGGLPIVAQADADPNGLFQIAVSPRRDYALRALPGPGPSPLARATFAVVSVGDGDTPVVDHSMPAALLFAGKVIGPAQGVGAALVQAYCETPDAACADPTTPVAETVTRTDGTFELMLPDPGRTP
jgi:hypothetical protein